MKELLTYIVQSLVDNPDEVSVTERKADGEIVYEVRVADGEKIKVDMERAQYWIANGAQPTDTVRGLLKKVEA